MNINKAIKKQEKSHKRFLLILGFIFFVLPLILFASGKLELFLIVYLIIIEMLILTTIIININNNYLKYSIENFKLKVSLNKFGEGYTIVCDKVVLVHSEKQEAEMEVIIITNSKFRNKKIKAVDEVFIRKYPYLSQEYLKIKRHNSENIYFYIVIKKGSFEKYRFLDFIYRNCLQANYTNEAVDRIKEYRNS